MIRVWDLSELTERKLLSIWFNCSGDESIQRSGLKDIASSPKTRWFLWTTHAFMPTTVPAGRSYPPILAGGPGGTRRSRGNEKAGWTRIDSLITACLRARYYKTRWMGKRLSLKHTNTASSTTRRTSQTERIRGLAGQNLEFHWWAWCELEDSLQYSI